jgi:hypothetical protein
VTDDLADLLGRPPRSLRTYVTDYAAEFEPADSTAETAETASQRDTTPE